MTRHDPNYAAVRRGLRAAILMPALFAIGDHVFENPTMAYFLAFGSFAMLLLVDFGGAIRDRLRAQFLLGVSCAVLVCLGTLAGQSTPVAVVAMGVVAFAILFAGAVSSVIASATISLLLAFILPVSLPGPVSQIPDRVAGWGLAGAVSLLAISVLWPAPARNPIRDKAVAAMRALAERLVAHVTFIRSDRGDEAIVASELVIERSATVVAELERVFFATAYRPTGLSTDARAVVRLVDELTWLGDIVALSRPGTVVSSPDSQVCEVKLAAAQVLERAADLLVAPASSAAELRSAEAALADRLEALEREVTARIEGPTAGAMVSALNPSFRAQELSFIVSQVARNVEYAAAAEDRSWLDQLLGRAPDGFSGTLSSARDRLAAHWRLSSAWLHNSLRGASALAMSVLVSDLFSVQHAFWVVFGTLAVLRTNALTTGQNMLRAVLGTTVGFVIGGALVEVVGSDTTVLWVLLPVSVLCAGVAPAAISFAAGQAAFTMTLLLLFNLLAPVGWTIGIIRVEDVALGGGVSLAVGLLFWPRGAVRALGASLSEAYGASIRYLSASVAYGLGRCDATAAGGVGAVIPRREAAAAAAASRRLDDTFRNYLADRGAKPVPLAEMTSLVMGVAGLRLAADAVVGLWEDSGVASGDRAAARAELAAVAERMTGWYDTFAHGLVGREPVPDPLEPDPAADGRLIDAVARDLEGGDGHATATGVRVIWTGDHLDAVRRLQSTLVAPARAVTYQRTA